MALLARLSLLAVLVLIVVSAYLRLAHSGIGCADWPACYGQIGQSPAEMVPLNPQSAYARIAAEAEQPLAWATPLHRGVASLLGLLIVFLNLMAVRQKKYRLVSSALLALTVFLALLGIQSGSLHSPAVVMGNLLGGFLMLGLLGWLVFASGGRAGIASDPSLRRWLLLALVMLGLQITLGGLTSANFAATACPTLPLCEVGWWPGPDLFTAMDLSRQHSVDAAGVSVGGAERIAIHQAHRLGAVVTLVIVLLAGWRAIRAAPGLRVTGLAVLLLVGMEFAVGIGAILTHLPIGLAVAHNALAAILLLTLLKLLNQTRETP